MEEKKHGTTTIGVTYDKGVVLVADKRATMGNLVAHKNVQKIHKVTDRVAVTIAGAVGDNQMLIRYLSAEIKKFEISKGKKADVNVVATLLSHILYSRRFSFAPYWVQILLAGPENSGYKLYSLGSDGSKVEDKYIATGSGSPVAYGLLQDKYGDEMSEKEALELSVKALNSALERDAYTGEGVDAVIITSNKVKRVSKDKIQKILKK